MEHIDAAVTGGGRSGLAAAHALLRRRLRPTAPAEASDPAAGPWPHCSDSPTLSSPARYSPLPAIPFPRTGPDHHPHHDEATTRPTTCTARTARTARTGHPTAEIRTGRPAA